MNLETIKKEFDDYVSFCEEAIISLGENKLLQGRIPEAKAYYSELLNAGLVSQNARDIDVIIAKRKELIRIKAEHTNRVTQNILRVADKIGVKVDLKNVLEVVARLHDIGRFEYATWNLSYVENYKKQEDRRKYFTYPSYRELLEPIAATNHSEAGFVLLTQKGKIKSLAANPEFLKVIGQAVLHHQDAKLVGEFSPEVNMLDDKLMRANLSDILKVGASFNEAERQVYAVLTQLIKDVDCIDILYQHLTGDYPILRPTATFNKNIRTKTGEVIERHSLEEFSARWGFTPHYVAEFNGLSLEGAEQSDVLQLPVYDKKSKKLFISPEKLVMPADLKEKFFNLERLDLQELNKRLDWNPIVGMWWRLLQFLGSISFTSNIEVLKESGILDEIYNLYPDEVKPNVHEAFDFAKIKLLENRGSDIYAINPFKK